MFSWLPTECPSWPIQQALLISMREGHLERHIRRMRGLYAKKRALLSEVLAPINHLSQVHGLEAGLHIYLELHDKLDLKSIVEEAAKQGVILSTLDPFYLGKPHRHGLLLGYGGLTLAEISQGVTILADVLASVASKVGL